MEIIRAAAAEVLASLGTSVDGLAAALALYAEHRSPGGGMWQFGVAILAVIFINGLFSFLQEYRAEQAITALRGMLPATVKVLRDGVLQAAPLTAAASPLARRRCRRPAGRSPPAGLPPRRAPACGVGCRRTGR